MPSAKRAGMQDLKYGRSLQWVARSSSIEAQAILPLIRQEKESLCTGWNSSVIQLFPSQLIGDLLRLFRGDHRYAQHAGSRTTRGVESLGGSGLYFNWPTY
jgi:hypothetical protein